MTRPLFSPIELVQLRSWWDMGVDVTWMARTMRRRPAQIVAALRRTGVAYGRRQEVR